MQGHSHSGPSAGVLRRPPAGPADHAVGRVVQLWVAQRKLLPVQGKLVETVSDPVRPRHQHLASSPAADLGDCKPVDQWPSPQGVVAEGRPHLGDDRTLLAEELRKVSSEPGAAERKYDEAAWLLDRLVSNDEFVEFLTEPAYEFVSGTIEVA